MKPPSKSLLAFVVLLASAGAAEAADSPYDKTFIGSAEVCFTRTGQCTGTVPIHVYLAKSGRLYSFLRSQGGQMFSLGQYVSVDGTQQRFIVKGSTLVFEDLINQNGAQLVLRGFLRSQGGNCAVTGSATYNGAPEPITMQASCEVYEGQR